MRMGETGRRREGEREREREREGERKPASHRVRDKTAEGRWIEEVDRGSTIAILTVLYSSIEEAYRRR